MAYMYFAKVNVNDEIFNVYDDPKVLQTLLVKLMGCINNSTKIDFNHSFICKYKEGSYLLLKFTGKDEQNEDSIKFALFVFSPKTEMYHYIINNKTLEKLEDLYLAIINVDSDVDSYIDDYLKDNFSTTYTEEIPF